MNAAYWDVEEYLSFVDERIALFDEESRYDLMYFYAGLGLEKWY